MELLALNKQWAVYSPVGEKGKLDAFSALQELLLVKNYQQLVKYLAEQTCNDSFLVSSDTDFADSFDREERVWRRRAADIKLQGNLSRSIDQFPSVDYLDELVASDLKGSKVYQLDLTELMDFQDVMRRFLTIAAIALGSEAPDGIFVDIPSEDIFDEQWIRDNVHCDPGTLHTIGFNQKIAGFRRKGILNEDLLDTVFNSTSGYSRHQLVIDDSKEYGKYTDGYPFSVDHVIYSYSEYYQPSEEERDPYDYEYYLTISFLDNVTPERARLLLAGRTVEAVLNSWLDLAEQRDFVVPYFPDMDYDRYKFVPGKGFVKRKVVEPPWWVTDLYDEAIDLILEGKVSLCPVCGSPVLIKDFRGRKSKLVCSDSCKTRASNQRRETAYQCAASGIPLEEAISRIGEEYARSVRKWYAEAQAFTAPKGRE